MGGVDILYFAGPGDVVGTFREWIDGRADLSGPSRAYSEQFYDVVWKNGWTAMVISRNDRADFAEGRGIRVQNLPRRRITGRIKRKFAEVINAVGAVRTVFKCKPHAVVMQEGTCPSWAMWVMRFSGARLIADMHCALWPDGYPPRALRHRLALWVNGGFTRGAVDRIICISPVIERQLVQRMGVQTDAIRSARPSYCSDRVSLTAISDPEGCPLRLFSAGRIEQDKGFGDLVRAVALINRRYPGSVSCRIAGDGPWKHALNDLIRHEDCVDQVIQIGHQSASEMSRELSECHAVVVPTTSGFAEGLNRVCLEAVLAGRPLVCTTVCPAAEVLGNAVASVPPDRPDLLAEVIERRLMDRVSLINMSSACAQSRKSILNEQLFWGNVLLTTLNEFIQPKKIVSID